MPRKGIRSSLSIVALNLVEKKNAEFFEESQLTPQPLLQASSRPNYLLPRLVSLFLLFACSFCIRLIDLDILPPQADEIHWLKRSQKVLDRVERGDLLHATTHLGQPGIPVCILLATVRYFSNEHNQDKNLKAGDAGHIDFLSAGRTLLAGINSLLPVLVAVFLMSLGLSGLGIVTGLLLAIDPHFYYLSRIAHLDAMLSLLVFACAFTWFWACERESTKLKLFSGLSWGLAISTKPTAVFLIPAFFVYGAIRKFLFSQNQVKLFSWVDVWTLVIGHMVLVSLYTRMYYVPWDYEVRMKVTSPLSGIALQAGTWFEAHSFFRLFLFSLFFLGLLWQMLSSKEKKLVDRIPHLGLLSLIPLGGIAYFKHTVQNIVLFWSWTLGLSKEKHNAFGLVVDPPPWGYLGIISSRLNEIVVIGIVLGFFVLGKKLIKKEFDLRTRGFLFLAIVSLLWVAPLQVSDKQSVRYLLPILACLYCLVGFGLRSLGKLQSPAILGLVLMGSFIFFSWFPKHFLYFNHLSGGLGQALERGFRVPLSGHNEVVDYFKKQGTLLEPVYVDSDVVNLNIAASRYSNRRDVPVSFKFSDDPKPGYYYVNFRTSRKELPDYGAAADDMASIVYKGVELASIELIDPMALVEPMRKSVLDMHRLKGKPFYLNQAGQTVSERPSEGVFRRALWIGAPETKGTLVYGDHHRFPIGRLKLSFEASINPGPEDPITYPERRAVFQVSLGKDCKRVFWSDELSLGALREESLECEHPDLFKGRRFELYWFGSVPVLFHGIQIEQLSAVTTY